MIKWKVAHTFAKVHTAWLGNYEAHIYRDTSNKECGPTYHISIWRYKDKKDIFGSEHKFADIRSSLRHAKSHCERLLQEFHRHGTAKA